MIFAPILSLLGLFVLFVLPLLGMVSTILLVGGIVARRVTRGKGHPLSRKARTWLWAFGSLTFAVDLWTGILIYDVIYLNREIHQQTLNRAARQDFVLERDFQYGELLIPAGSQIHRYDPFDNGEKDLPLALRGLSAVHFPHPVQLAGVSAIAMEVFPARLELTTDQTIGPLFTYGPNGELVRDNQRATIACKQGQVARFNAPLIPYDVVAEFAKPEPDGPAARFKPSQWQFLGCEDDGPIELPRIPQG
ncbi:hypothetical protein [Rhizobium sp. BR 315]|uniref:hypothetical protein n=1 Tax=Rhizobium sp. BR 315 TaxID=3040014 RepID=UPI003D32F34C